MDLSLMKPLDISEIRTVLEKAALFGGKVAQPTLTSNLTSVIKRMDVDHSGTMSIKLFEEPSIENDRPISIHLNYRNLSFRLNSGEYKISGTTIITSLPKEAKALASRDISERYILPFNSKIEGSLSRIERRDKSAEIKSHLIDVSKFGLGLHILNTEEGILQKHDHLWIRSINGVQLSRPLFGRIVYVLQREYSDKTLDLRVGVSLDSALPEEIFRELQQMCKLILTA